MNVLKRLFELTDPRGCILTVLRPFDIVRLLVATRCTLTLWERTRYMDLTLMDNFFHDYNEIKTLLRAGVHIVLLGHRLGLLFKKAQSS
jgi:hypothetical protein